MQSGKDDHEKMRTLLHCLEEKPHLRLSSEAALELTHRLFHLMVHHFKSECQILKDICESIDDFQSHDLHCTDMLTQLTDFNFELLTRRDNTIATILPRIRNLIEGHDNFHAHSALLNQALLNH